MRHVSAFTGEFGLKVYQHVPQVYALCTDEQTTVEIERGEEALYPAASRWEVVERGDDDARRGHPAQVYHHARRFVPEPHEPQGIGPLDVVVCPRWRDYGSSKNWPGWQELTLRLCRADLNVYAAGAPDSSQAVKAPRAWERERFLDASLEAMLNSSIVVATDAGLAHLAVLCGADLLLVTYRGRVAPGPVVTSSGALAAYHYQRAGWDRSERVNRLEAANHRNARIEYVDGWEHPERVVGTVMKRVAGRVVA